MMDSYSKMCVLPPQIMRIASVECAHCLRKMCGLLPQIVPIASAHYFVSAEIAHNSKFTL